MTHTTKAVLLALSLVTGSGCGGGSDDPPPVLVEPRLAMRCSFAAQSSNAMPGEAFLYILYDSTGGVFAVDGLARAEEDLASQELGLWGDLPPHTAVKTEQRIDWTERDEHGDEVRGFIGTALTTGEEFTSTGVVRFSKIAYPACFAFEL